MFGVRLRVRNAISARKIRTLVPGKDRRLRRRLPARPLAGLARLERRTQSGTSGERGDPRDRKLRHMADRDFARRYARAATVHGGEADQHAPYAWRRGVLLRAAASDALF